jgi:hypothetical protein
MARRVLRGASQDFEHAISSEEMQQFYQFLKAFSMPNGSIVQFTWHAGVTPRPGKVITDHLPEWKEKKSGVALWLQNSTAALAPLKTCISV